MACEQRVFVLHVHGHDADIEVFFDALTEAMYGVVENIPALYPSIQIIPTEEGD